LAKLKFWYKIFLVATREVTVSSKTPLRPKERFKRKLAEEYKRKKKFRKKGK
jgi:hypothetical protein